MEPRPTHVLIATLALVCLGGGLALLRPMPAAAPPGARRAPAANSAPAASTTPPPLLAPPPPPQTLAQLESFGGLLKDLRGHMAPPAGPAPGEPAQSEPGAEAPPPEPGAPQVEAQFSFPDALIPAPPQRPRDIAAAPSSAPLPPTRPSNLAQDASLAPEAAPAVGAPTTPLFPEAPLPPVRPRNLALAAPEATTPAPPAAPSAAAPDAGVQIAARPPEPALQAPAPPGLEEAPAPVRLGMGAPVFVRIFKREGQLELWLKSGARYSLYRTYPICKWSGHLGPKVKEADYQSPEGFYSVSARQLHPHSNYHRAFNVGYPNAFDRQNGHTGGLVMVHGNCKSVGCFAMTDKGIEEIYGFVAAALAGGQREVPVHIFPFHLTETAIAQETGSGGLMAFLSGGGTFPQYAEFWRNLKQGYDLFERTGEPPTAYACGDHYAFGSDGGVCKRIAGW